MTRFFMGTADVQLAAERLARKFEELGIPYAICGGLAVFVHGHERMTKDVDVLVTAEGLRRFRENALGLGWLERFPGSRGVRDTDKNVPIDLLVSGGYPGDGTPRGVAFPDPATCAERKNGKQYVSLPKLIELKLACGLSSPDRPRDFDDVIQLVRANALPESFVHCLHPEVQPKFRELWGYAQRPIGEY
ncbi:MAG TPA: hypothetical protein VFT55_09530 [Planctomycetota bacterium]|nr:hypothetical protein [Planctomycetota bacterium]